MQTYSPAETSAIVTAPDFVEGAPSLASRISWGAISWGAILGGAILGGAILAGAIVALAIGLMLNTLGAAVGAAIADTNAQHLPDASSFGIGAAAWLLISNLIGLAVGGYVAARLSGTADGTDSALHGLAVWAASLLVSALLLGNLIAGVAATAISGATNVLGGLAHGAGSMVSTVGNQVADHTSRGNLSSGVQSLISQMRGDLAAPTKASDMNSAQRRVEITKLIRKRIVDGTMSQADRSRLDDLVAAELGVSRDQAKQKIAQVEQNSQADIAKLKQDAQQAAKATARGAAVSSFAVFATMLLGLLSAVLGSRRGTRDVLERRALR